MSVTERPISYPLIPNHYQIDGHMNFGDLGYWKHYASPDNDYPSYVEGIAVASDKSMATLYWKTDNELTGEHIRFLIDPALDSPYLMQRTIIAWNGEDSFSFNGENNAKIIFEEKQIVSLDAEKTSILLEISPDDDLTDLKPHYRNSLATAFRHNYSHFARNPDTPTLQDYRMMLDMIDSSNQRWSASHDNSQGPDTPT